MQCIWTPCNCAIVLIVGFFPTIKIAITITITIAFTITIVVADYLRQLQSIIP